MGHHYKPLILLRAVNIALQAVAARHETHQLPRVFFLNICISQSCGNLFIGPVKPRKLTVIDKLYYNHGDNRKKQEPSQTKPDNFSYFPLKHNSISILFLFCNRKLSIIAKFLPSTRWGFFILDSLPFSSGSLAFCS